MSMDRDFESEDIANVNKLLRRARAQAKWEQIALGLGLSSTTIKDIREKYSRDDQRLYSSLDAWVNGKGKVQTTWRILIHTLQSEDVKESAVADKIMAEKVPDKVLLSINDLGLLYDFVKEESSQWCKIGLKLSFEAGELEAIKGMPLLIGEGPEGYLRELLRRWLRRTDRPYLQDLAEAIQYAGNKRLGVELVTRYLTTTKQTKVPDKAPVSINDLGLLYDLVKEESSQWYMIGLKLSFKVGELEAIKGMPLLIIKGPEGYFRELLRRWLRRTDQPYLQDLAEAIQYAGNKRLGVELVTRYLTTTKQTKDATDEDQSTCRLEDYFRSNRRPCSQHTKEEWPPTLNVEYINLVMIEGKQLVTDMDQQQRKAKLILKGEIQGVLNELECHNLDLKDITNYSTRDSNHKVIIIEGAPGVGKTTLAQKLCKGWADGQLLTEFSLVIYIPLHVPKLRVAEHVEDVMMYLFEDYSPADLQAVKTKGGVGVLFVLDGWDELPQSCRGRDMFFPKLIRGKSLPKCDIIVTSRPGVTADIREHGNRFIEILGFSEDQIKQYIHSYFRQYDNSTNSGKMYADKLIDELQQYPNVASTCYIAINLTITCYVYITSNYHLPSTLTEVYELFILHAVKRHFRRVNEKAQLHGARNVTRFNDEVKAALTNLGKLAFEGLKNDDLSFNEEQMKRICKDDKTVMQDGFGLLKRLYVFRKHGPETLFQFLHLTIQEYLAAYSIMQMGENEQFEKLKDILGEERFGTVLNFFSGMDKFNSCPSRIVYKHSNFATPMVLESIFEGQWEDGCRKIAQDLYSTRHLCSILSVPRTIQPYRSLVYGYVMAKSGTQWTLERYCCEISEHEVKSLSRYLLPAPRTLCCLHIQKANIVPEAVPHLHKIIQSQTGLLELNLIEVCMNDETLCSLSKALCNHRDLKVLRLSSNRLTSSSAETVCALLKQLPSLHTLDLSQNELGEACCKTILAVVATNKTLAELHLPTTGKATWHETETLNTSRNEGDCLKTEFTT